MGVTSQGLAAIVETRGNKDCHIVLRGSDKGPNYDSKSISEAQELMKKSNLKPSIMVDCSHGNSLKNHENQIKVIQSIVEQLELGNSSIIGCMIESNLVAGNQTLEIGCKHELKHGQSITDACVDFDETIKMINMLDDAVKKRRQKRATAQ